MPKLSILIPTYNRARWIGECLDSLAATTADCEIVVADNASTDDTPERLAAYAHDPRFRFHRHATNIGAGPNYDFLLGQARGEYVCLFGDDDLAMPGCFESKLAMFEAMPALDFVYSLWHRIDADGRDLGVMRWPGLLGHSYAGGRDEFQDLLIASYIMFQSVVFRRSLFEGEGGMITPLALKAANDWHMLLRFVKGRQTGFLGAPTVKVREHAASYTSTVARTEAMFAHDKLMIWRHWLLDHPATPVVLDEETWQRMARSLAGDVHYSFGDDPARMAEYQNRLNALRQEIVDRQEAPILKALGMPPVERARPVEPQPPVRVLYHAPIYDPSGYADEARHVILGLEDLGVPVAARALGRHSPTFKAQLAPATRDLLDRALGRPVTPDFISVIHFPAMAFQRLPEAAYRIGRTMFETDSLPPDWVAKCNLMDEVWVPSAFNVETFRAAGVTTKLVTVPGGVDTFRFRPGLQPRPLAGARGTVFLAIFEWSYRKGWDALLRAWAEAFPPDADVTLALRTYPINKTEGDHDMDAWVTLFLREGLGLERHQVAPILVITEQVPDAEMPNLFAAASAYVAPSRGEGWGRPQMEAMACGLPVIATRWSGNMAFMTDENALLLDYDGLVTIDSRTEMAIYHGQHWAEPSVSHLVTLLRRVVAEPAAMVELGARARADMERHWRWEKAAAVAAGRLAAIADELDARPPVPPPAPDSLPVRWEGTQLNVHSFAMVNRELSKRLIASGRVELAAASKEPIEFKPTPDLVPVERALAHRLSRPPAVTVRHQWPPDFTPPESGAWVMMQPWEFGGLPDAWVAGMAHGPDEMWVYTHWLRDCYLKSGLPADRVHVVPLGVDVERYRPEGPAYPLKTRKGFKFLYLGGTIPRKGVDVLLESYLATFTADDDVCLVIKGVGGESFYSNSPIQAMLRQLLERSAGDPRMPEIEYLDASLTDDEVAAMYRACDALVHPYRGEGFGLPVAEAMACGLPVIVTGVGACRDFCDETTAYLVPAIEVPITVDDFGPSRAGYWWAEPDRAALGAIMRAVAADPAAAREVGRRGRARIAEAFTWDRGAAIALERLEGLAGRPPVRTQPPNPFRPGLAPLPLDEHRRVVFFHHPDWATDAWREVVAAYLRAVDAEADATLVLWLDPQSGVQADLATEAILEVVAESGRAPETVPDLLLVPDPLSPDDLARLYTAATVVVPGGDPLQAERAAKVGKPVLASLDAEAWRAALG